MIEQTLTEYRMELADIKKTLGFDTLLGENQSKASLVEGVLVMARSGKHPARKVRQDDGPQFSTRDPLADVLLAVLHR
tara:strand:+ start:2597 stop:2830 length:234 start_codon:yes stop_codon:yes gene_type:complete